MDCSNSKMIKRIIKTVGRKKKKDNDGDERLMMKGGLVFGYKVKILQL